MSRVLLFTIPRLIRHATSKKVSDASIYEKLIQNSLTPQPEVGAPEVDAPEVDAPDCIRLPDQGGTICLPDIAGLDTGLDGTLDDLISGLLI